MSGFLLHLLRHGAPDGAGRLMGRTDCAPAPQGIAACVERAAGLEIETVVSSDLARSRRAGEALAKARSVPLTVDSRWRELDFGAWDGLAADEVDREALGRFWNDPDACPPPGGERWSDLTARVARALENVTGPALVVTHGGAMRAALAVLCGFGQRQLWAFDLPYASLLSFRLYPGKGWPAQIVGLRP